ncbi:MAG: MFS transporter [Proteobacteria bacterium]|nr:MFS transporter [Pseudomonadota bacterium]
MRGVVERRAWWLVGVLTFTYAVSFLDRTILVLLLQPIKEHFALSDTMLGLLHGFGFVLFYLLLGLPIGRWVDRYERRFIAALGALTWTIMTAICGLAPNFTVLLLARLGVGAGEATVGPASLSMIGDALPSDQQPRALSVYAMGISIGSAMALIAGGWLYNVLQQHGGMPGLPLIRKLEPWQVVFLVACLPGFMAAASLMLIAEPPRRLSGEASDSSGRALAPVRIADVLKYVRAQGAAYAGIIGGSSALVLVGYGIGTWIPTFLIRTYGLSMAQVGITYGFISILSGLSGAATAGQVASVMGRRNHRDASLIAVLVALSGMMLCSVFTLARDATTAFGGLAAFMFFNGMPFGVCAAALNQITPGRLRGQMSAVFHISINVVGVGIGPLLVGWLTDHVFTAGDGLRYSMLSLSVAGLPLVMLIFSLIRRRFVMAREAADQWRTFSSGGVLS